MDKDKIEKIVFKELLKFEYEVMSEEFEKAAKQIAEAVVKNCSIPDVVGQSEQLKAEGRKEATEEIRQWLIDMDYEGLAESL